jgi:nucleotide-binding universal stress UspA family protein
MTRPIHTILVPLDLTENAEAIVEWAIGWALMTHAQLVLLHVVAPINNYLVPIYPDPMGYDQHYARARDAARERLLPLAHIAEARGVDASIRVQIGFPTEEILSLAGEAGAGLIILGTHGRKGLAHVFLGSTAEKVVRLAECPVFVVKEGHTSTVHEEKIEAATVAAG